MKVLSFKVTFIQYHCLCQVGSDATLSDSLRVKALSCIAFLIKLKSKVIHQPTISSCNKCRV